MKITKSQLKQLIREELKQVNEGASEQAIIKLVANLPDELQRDPEFLVLMSAGVMRHAKLAMRQTPGYKNNGEKWNAAYTGWQDSIDALRAAAAESKQAGGEQPEQSEVPVTERHVKRRKK